MQITVCDDTPKDLKKIRTAVDTYAKVHSEYYFNINEYRSADDVLHTVERGKAYDIALLDICMPGIPGTDIAREIKEENGVKIKKSS